MFLLVSVCEILGMSLLIISLRSSCYSTISIYLSLSCGTMKTFFKIVIALTSEKIRLKCGMLIWPLSYTVIHYRSKLCFTCIKCLLEFVHKNREKYMQFTKPALWLVRENFHRGLMQLMTDSLHWLDISEVTTTMSLTWLIAQSQWDLCVSAVRAIVHMNMICKARTLSFMFLISRVCRQRCMRRMKFMSMVQRNSLSLDVWERNWEAPAEDRRACTEIIPQLTIPFAICLQHSLNNTFLTVRFSCCHRIGMLTL